MGQMVRVVFDGEVLRPEQAVDLRPNVTYVVTIEHEASTLAASDASYPLTEIASLATDMGVTDLSERHDRYAHGSQADGLRDT